VRYHRRTDGEFYVMLDFFEVLINVQCSKRYEIFLKYHESRRDQVP
jgi:hypothetical protein